jgi:hypothetical protein
MNIYLDMDDVVADWIPYAQEVLKMRWDDKKGERIPQKDWDKLKEDLRFYAHLPLKPGAHDLVDHCLRYAARNPGTRVAFLTALPHDYSGQYASYDKVFWADKHFPGIPVFFGPFSYDKYRHCKPGDILIDDRHSNCSEWIAAGGTSHIYTTWEACKPWLEETLGDFGQKL